MNISPILLMAIALLVVGPVFFYLIFSSGASGRTLSQRMKRVAESTAEATAKGEKFKLTREVKDSSIPLVDHFLKTSLPKVADKFRNQIAQAGLKISVSEYLLIMGLVGFVMYGIFHMALHFKPPLALIAGLGFGFFLPHTFLKIKTGAREKKFIKFFPESIDTMVRSIRSGLPIAEAVNVVATEMPDPVGEEFRSIRDGVRMGRSLEEAMWDVAKRINIAEYRYLIIAMSIQKETGGNLGETLHNVGDVLRKRRQMRLKIKAMSSEAKASAIILGSLPFLVSGVLSILSSGYISILFEDPRGNILLGIAFSMLFVGIFIMSQMINFEI
jgi:tight adherence protein B